MTVAELIKQLEKMPHSASVFFQRDHIGFHAANHVKAERVARIEEKYRYFDWYDTNFTEWCESVSGCCIYSTEEERG